jgi:hypothetical protein
MFIALKFWRGGGWGWNNVKVLFILCSPLSESALALLKGSQALLTCHSNKNRIKMKMNMKRWWNSTKYSERNLSYCTCIHLKWNYNSRQSVGINSYYPWNLLLWFQYGYCNSQCLLECLCQSSSAEHLLSITST